jgi:integrase/recombinase XerD
MLISGIDINTNMIHTNSELIEKFSLYLKRKDKAKSTITAYNKDIQQLAEESKKPLEDLSESDIDQLMRSWIFENKFAVKTVSRKLNSIRTFYNFLTEKQIILKNPAIDIRHPKFRPSKQRVLTKVEIQHLRTASEDNLKCMTIIEIMLQTGIRIGELSRLKVKDVVLIDTPYIRIGKFSKTIERKVHLNDKALQIIRLYLSSLVKKSPELPLFATKNNKPIQVRNIRAMIDKVIKKSKIKEACVNDLRNTFITFQLSQGFDINELAVVVGHKTTATTNRYLELLTKKYRRKSRSKIYPL